MTMGGSRTGLGRRWPSGCRGPGPTWVCMSNVDLQQAVQLGAAGYRHRVLFTCGDGLMAHQLGARELGAQVVVDPTLPPAEVLVTANGSAERVPR